MFDAILPQFGITTKFVKHDDPKGFEKAITPRTRALCRDHRQSRPRRGGPCRGGQDRPCPRSSLVVDATFTTPYLLKSIDHGADIVVNSLTKWLGGHGTGIGGIATDAGKFDWKDKKFQLFNEPDPNYHGLKWAHDLPAALAPIAFVLRLRTVPLRNLGACISPDNAWLFLQGIESLPVRMDRHNSNALAVATWLKKHPKVSWVRYPGLPDDPTYPVASRYLKNGFGGMVVFGTKGGKAAAEKFINSLKLLSHLANVGDAKSLALHPASTSHSQLSEEQQREGGLTPELVRLSIGIGTKPCSLFRVPPGAPALPAEEPAETVFRRLG